MAANPLHLIIVEELCELQEPIGDYDYELRHGKPVPVTHPKLKPYVLQSRFCDLLCPLAPSGSFPAKTAW